MKHMKNANKDIKSWSPLKRLFKNEQEDVEKHVAKYRPLTVNELENSPTSFTMGQCIIQKRDVVSISLNEDTVPNDGIGGAISVATKRRSKERGFYTTFHTAVFSNEAMPTVLNFVEEFEKYEDVGVNKASVPNSSFVLSFP